MLVKGGGMIVPPAVIALCDPRIELAAREGAK